MGFKTILTFCFVTLTVIVQSAYCEVSSFDRARTLRIVELVASVDGAVYVMLIPVPEMLPAEDGPSGAFEMIDQVTVLSCVHPETAAAI